MFVLLRIVISLFLLLVLLVVLTIGGVFIGLNTGAGRGFAVREINHFAGPQIAVAGLGGHFPSDIKISSVSVADSGGVWLTGENLELRWLPAQLWHRDVHVTALTASTLDVERAPTAAKQSKSSSSSLPDFRLAVDRLAVSGLKIGPSLGGGRTVVLAVSGATHLKNISEGSVALQASTPDGQSKYQLSGSIDPKNVALRLNVAEPPDGLLGHYAGPQVHDPLALDVALDGPRENAALKFAAGLGAAQLDGAGTLGLDPNTPHADVVLSVPALAPFAALAHANVAGDTRLHLVIARQEDGSSSLALDGDVGLTQAPQNVAKLVGPTGHLSILATLADQTVTVQKFDVSGSGFEASASGTVLPSGFNLTTYLMLKQVHDLSPKLAGSIQESGTVIGSAKDFAVSALLTGDVSEQKIPSGPFNITINAQHLPAAPVGTVTGSGALENFPLLLDAAFSRDSTGTSVIINNAMWRSVSARANLALAPGAELPTGTATFTLGNLADFAAFSPIPLRGSVAGDFSHLDGQIFKLDLDAKNLVAVPSLGAVNATIHALGPTNALAVKATAAIAKIMTAPAKITLAGVFDLDHRAANVSAFTASWKTLNAVLQGPTRITTAPGLTVRNLSLGLSGGRIGLDGTLTPALQANVTVDKLPLAIARIFAPTVNATGTVSATAALTGSLKAPNGQFTLAAADVRLHSGPAAALPPATLSATATVTGKTANISAKLGAGAQIALTAVGLVPLDQTGALNLHVTGRTDLRLLDPILAAQGSIVRGLIAADLTVTGSPTAPRANGGVTLSGGSVENIGSGLNLTAIGANIQAAGRTVDLTHFSATAGHGTISGHGSLNLGDPTFPLDLTIDAANATPVSSDVVTERIDAALTVTGALHSKMALAGRIKIDSANINIPKSLPPSVANLPIVNAGAPPPPPAPKPLPISVDLTVTAPSQIFVRGDGLFAELGGQLRVTGTAADPDPEGGFQLIRGNFSLAGKNLQFTQGNVSFNGDGFMPTLDLEATSVTSTTTATLIVGGTAAQPTITLTSTPPMPSDEILAQLLFGQSTTSLTAFQAASLAAALAQLSGVGGTTSPLDAVRSALGLDELSLSGSGSGPPSVQAGRYVAPGVYVGATQATNGQGTQASVQINLYKGLKLETATGTSSTGSGDASSVGLTYQFNY
jgi:translocation and assembly module TamB